MSVNQFFCRHNYEEIDWLYNGYIKTGRRAQYLVGFYYSVCRKCKKCKQTEGRSIHEFYRMPKFKIFAKQSQYPFGDGDEAVRKELDRAKDVLKVQMSERKDEHNEVLENDIHISRIYIFTYELWLHEYAKRESE